MKKNILLLFLLSILGLVTSCYDDSELRERIEKLENTTAVIINQQITALQSSIEALKSVDFDLKNQIAALEAAGTSHQDEINALKEKDEELLRKIGELQDSIDSLRTWVEEILKNYTMTEEMNEQFAAVQEQIDQLKAQVALLLAAPDILFEVDGSIAYSPDTTIEVKYTLVNTDEETELECIADAGWTASIIPAKDGKSGIISVTTPSEGGEGKVLFFVSTKLNTAMRVLRFEQGILTVLTNSITVEPQDTLLTIDARTNVDYHVVIPAEAQQWIELRDIDTRAIMRTDVITLAVTLNATSQSRSAVITLVDTQDKELSSFTIFQRADVQGANEIWYTSTDGNIVEPSNPRGFGGVNIVSNTYVKGKGVIVFDGELTTIGNGAFQDDTWSYRLLTVSLPEGITSIGENAFFDCGGLTSITSPESVTTIGICAFDGCSKLNSITIPNSVTIIGISAFGRCSSLTSVTIPESVTSIGGGAFQYCSSLTSVTIPESVTNIPLECFRNCNSLTSVFIPNSVTSIGNYAFYECTSLTSVTIPNSVSSIEPCAFCFCSSLTSVVCLRKTPLYLSSDVFSNDVTDYCILYVPAESVSAYSVAEGWKEFKEIKEIDN